MRRNTINYRINYLDGKTIKIKAFFYILIRFLKKFRSFEECGLVVRDGTLVRLTSIFSFTMDEFHHFFSSASIFFRYIT